MNALKPPLARAPRTSSLSAWAIPTARPAARRRQIVRGRPQPARHRSRVEGIPAWPGAAPLLHSPLRLELEPDSEVIVTFGPLGPRQPRSGDHAPVDVVLAPPHNPILIRLHHASPLTARSGRAGPEFFEILTARSASPCRGSDRAGDRLALQPTAYVGRPSFLEKSSPSPARRPVVDQRPAMPSFSRPPTPSLPGARGPDVAVECTYMSRPILWRLADRLRVRQVALIGALAAVNPISITRFTPVQAAAGAALTGLRHRRANRRSTMPARCLSNARPRPGGHPSPRRACSPGLPIPSL